MKGISLFFFLAITGRVLLASTYYVDTLGDDSNKGLSTEQALASIARAIQLVEPGDTILVRGGVYLMEKKISISKSGLPGKTIKLWAFPGELPFLNFSSLPEGNTDRGLTLNARYWHIKGFEIAYAGDNGLIIDSGHFNLIENCTFRNNGDTGLQISGGSAYNEVINCDSYFNEDLSLENADGFAAKIRIGSGNRFVACRAWANADDGWDLYEGDRVVEIHYCWAFRNGYLEDGSPAVPNGDMNGFKLGGNGVAADHLVTHSLSFYNGSKGFDQNNNSGIITLLNNSAWMNGNYYEKPNFSFPSRSNIFKNNISFQGADEDRLSSGESENNSWDGFMVDSSDFLSLDQALATQARQMDGNLPEINLLRLAVHSDLINAGVDAGFPYAGAAPSLGAWDTDELGGQKSHMTLVTLRSVQGVTHPASNRFIRGADLLVEAVPFDGYLFKEWTGTVSSPDNPVAVSTDTNHFLIPVFEEDTSSVFIVKNNTDYPEMQLFPNPATDILTIRSSGVPGGEMSLSLSDASGRVHKQKAVILQEAVFRMDLDLSSLPGGVYVVTLSYGGMSTYKKLLKL